MRLALETKIWNVRKTRGRASLPAKISRDFSLSCRPYKLLQIWTRVMIFVQNHVDLVLGWFAANGPRGLADLIPFVQ